MAERKLKFLAGLEEKRPHLYERFMMQELGIAPEEEKGEIGKFRDTLGALQEVGAFQNPNDLGGGMFGGVMKDLMPILALGFLGAINPSAAAKMQEHMEGQLSPGQVPAELAPGNGEAQADSVKLEEQEHRMFSPQSWLFIQAVKGKSPQEAAGMIIGAQKQSTLAKEIVEGFCKARDNEELRTFINNTVQAHPEFRGFFEWAVKQPWKRQPAPAWFLECIQEIRQQMGGGSSQPQAASTGL